VPRERREEWEDAETRVVRRDETVARRPPPPEPPPWWRENWWIWLVALAVVVLGGLLIVAAWPSDDETTTTTAEGLVAVPRVVGLSEERAVGRLEGAGFEVEVERGQAEAPEGQVVAQDPEPGSRVETGSTVTIRVAEPGPETVTVTETTPTETEPEAPAAVQVPDVVGQEHFIGAADVEQFGLVADTYPVDSTEAQGIVVAQSPAPGTELREGETVRLNVSLGGEPRPDVTVPDVTGPAAAEARTACREAGLTCRTVYRSAPSAEEVGEVLDQRPAAGTVVPLLTQLTLFVGR
jgi:beta-lactam-binding protein with PASTA domain